MSPTTLSREQLIIFMRQLGLVLDSDISLHEGLSLIKEKADDADVSQLLNQMMQTVAMGGSLSDAMAEQKESFPRFVLNMIKIGEESGELSYSLNQVADSYEKELESNAKVRSAVTYPIVLALLMLAVIMVLVLQVLPMFNDILLSLGGEMPVFTSGLMSASLWLGQHSLTIFALIAVFILALFFYLRSARGSKTFDRLKFKLPVFKRINASLAAVRFSRHLSLLIKSGISTSRGMRLIASTFDNQYAAQKIVQAADAIDRGEAADVAIEKLELFPWVLIKLFSIAAKTGHMDTVLDKAATNMETELDNRLDRLTTVIEPLLIIILSVIVGVILISVILPIVNIMNAIG